jgi:hypothetical protein
MSDQPSSRSSKRTSREITRRELFQVLGSGSGLVLLACSGEDPGSLEALGSAIDPLAATLSALLIVRPEDMLVLYVTSLGLGLSGGKVVKTRDDAFLIVDLPPQAVFERAYLDSEAPTAVVPSKLSGKSRIVVKVAADYKPGAVEPATFIDILRSGDLVVPSLATELKRPTATVSSIANIMSAARFDRAIAAFDPDAAQRFADRLGLHIPISILTDAEGFRTEIELPYRLQISPVPGASFGASTLPVKSAITGRVELWNTYLGRRDPESKKVYESADTLLIAPIKKLPEQGTVWPASIPVSLTDTQRGNIVKTTNDTKLGAPANQVMLSALGGYMEVHGRYPDGNTVEQWDHVIAAGREHYVQIIEFGYLYPCGHPATVTTTTVREERNGKIGVLRQTSTLTLKSPVVVTSIKSAPTAEDRKKYREFPFGAVKLKQQSFEIDGIGSAGWIKRGNKNLKVSATGLDCASKEIHFDTDLYFIKKDGSFEANLTILKNTITFQWDLRGQRVSFAHSEKDDTSFETQKLVIKPVAAAWEPMKVLPTVDTLDIVVEAVQRLKRAAAPAGGAMRALALGAPSAPTPTESYKYASEYLGNAFDGVGNKAQLLFSKADVTSIDVGKVTEGSPSFMTPSLAYDSISRKAGPILKSALSASGEFDPKEAMSKVPPLPGVANPLDAMKLFGCFSLTDVLEKVTGELDPMQFAPKFVSDALNGAEKVIAELQQLQRAIVYVQANGRELAKKAVGDKKLQIDALVVTGQDIIQKAATCVTDITSGDLPKAKTDLLALREKLGAKSISDKERAEQLTPGDLLTLRGELIRLFDMGRLQPELATVDGIREQVEKGLDTISDTLKDVQKVIDMLAKAQKGLEAARDLAVKIEWRPKLMKPGTPSPPKDDEPLPLKVAKDIFFPESQYGMLLAMEIRAKAQAGKPAGVDLMCRLDRFSLRMGADTSEEKKAELTAKFKRFVLKRDAGKKPDVDIIFDGLVFGGKLAFVETLKNLIPLDGFSDPPYLDINSEGIVAGFSIAIPNIAVGVFSIENISFGAQLTLPFIGEAPIFSFNFCTEENPFLVTYAMFGGGGYFRLELTPFGFHSLTLSMNIGAQLAYSAGVASGAVNARIGLTMTLLADGRVELTAFMRSHGHLQALGMVSISIDILFSLTYDGCKLYGVAKLNIEIELRFLVSVKIEIKFERTLVGANGDPTLREVMSPFYAEPLALPLQPLSDYSSFLIPELELSNTGAGLSFPWEEYCRAYATT